MKNLFLLPLGACSHPLAFKCDVFSALGTIGSSIIGGIGSAIGQSDANAANKKIAREQMNWQRAERNASQQWQEMMWQKNNLYNSPSAIRQRLTEAGYNPWLSGSEQVGQGASMPSAPNMPSSPNMPTQQPVDYGAPFAGAASSLLNVAQLALNKQGVDANVSNQNTKTFKQVLDNAHQMKLLGYPRASIHRYISDNSTYGNDLSNDKVYDKFMNDYLKGESERDMAALEYKLALNYAEPERNANLNLLKQSLNEVVSKINLNSSQAALNGVIAKLRVPAEVKKLLSEARKNHSEAETIDQLRSYLRQKLIAEIDVLGWTSKRSEQQFNIDSPKESFNGSSWADEYYLIDKITDDLIDKWTEMLSPAQGGAQAAKILAP